jgi:hypothetical protein
MFLAGGCSSHVWDLEGIPQADGVIELANGWDPKVEATGNAHVCDLLSDWRR